MGRPTFQKPKRGFFLNKTIEELPDEDSADIEERKLNTELNIRKEMLLHCNEQTTPGITEETIKGLPKIVPPPELEQAKEEATQEEVAAINPLRPTRSEEEMDQMASPSKKIKPKAGARRKRDKVKAIVAMEKKLSDDDWHAVATAYALTENAQAIAHQTNLTKQQVEHIIENGIQSKNLPSVKQATHDKAKANLAARKAAQQNQVALFSDDVATAIQSRATQEAAAAHSMLQQSIQAGNMITGYVKALFQQLSTGQSRLEIPEEVNLNTFDTLTKVVDSHTRAMERAIKMVRLTQGEPTELIEHQIGAMLAVCTTRELEEAAHTGNLPRRLTARISGSDPVQAESRVIDVKHEEVQEQTQSQEEHTSQCTKQPHQETKTNSTDDRTSETPIDKPIPEWMQTIAPAEGESAEDTVSDKLQSLDELGK